MIEHRIDIQDAAARKAFEALPEVMTRHVDGQLERGAQEVAREEVAILGENKSMLTSELALSILSGVKRIAPLHWQVRAGTNYARAVEEGTGPAAGRAAYMPNSTSLLAYVKQRARIIWRGKPGSPQRRSLQREVRDRAFALALHIRKFGTKPHPFAKPALERKRSRLFDLVQAGAAGGLAEIFGSQA